MSGAIFAVASPLSCLSRKGLRNISAGKIQYAGLAAITDLRNEIYEKLVRQPIGFFRANTTGRLMSAVINDVERVRHVFGKPGLFFQHMFTLFFLVVSAADQLEDDPGLGIFLLRWFCGRCARWARAFAARWSPARRGSANLSQILQETLSGNRVVKAFGMEGLR